MSLSVKRIALLLSFASAVLITACDDDPKEIGLPQDQSLGVFFTDTITVKTSTVLVDSVITFKVVSTASGPTAIGTSYLLAGRADIPAVGTVTAKSFVRPRFNSNAEFNLGDAPILDSLVLHLAYRYSYGDTNTLQTLNIYELADSIYRDRTYYSFDQINIQPVPVGSESFRPVPRRGDTLRIPLSAGLGNKLLSLSGQSQNDFVRSFFGLSLVPDENDNASVVGYSLSRSFLRLYYTSGGTAKTYDFSLSGTYAFNNIRSNKAQTPWAALQNLYIPLPSTAPEAQNQTLIQAGIGIMTKIEIPHINELQELGNIAINRAELVVSPTGANPSIIAPQLALYDINSNGTILREQGAGLLIPLSTDFTSAATSVLQNSSYTFNITNYLNQVLRGYRENNGLFLSTPSTAVNLGSQKAVVALENSLEESVVPVIIGDQNHPTQPLELRIYYTPISAN